MAINDTSQNNNPPPRLLLVSVPRTASNLLVKILNIQNQPNVLTNEFSGYFFYPAHRATAWGSLLKKPSAQWSDTKKQEVQAAFQECFNAMELYSAQAQTKNKIMFAKEHASWFTNPAAFDGTHDQNAEHPDNQDMYRLRTPDTYGTTQTFSGLNKTVLPDEYLRTWQLAFIIRHPALAWPSMYRAMAKASTLRQMDDDGVEGASLASMTLRWTRMLFDWCLEQSDAPGAPMLLDAHDIIHNPQVLRRFCEQVGLDPALLQFEWNETTEDKVNHEILQNVDRQTGSLFVTTLKGSSSVIKEKAPMTVDIAVEAEKWKAEFGEEIAALIEKAVWDSMPDYENLRAQRMMA
ncbi:hypothetical protein BJX63DRAFT_440220 [Aspergillus granulosus]|uniref:Uncharacterized protein n=1 Tax=Aspergillus granulosus TaxID=176169 RepID=A0ABR4GW59_9EURO